MNRFRTLFDTLGVLVAIFALACATPPPKPPIQASPLKPAAGDASSSVPERTLFRD